MKSNHRPESHGSGTTAGLGRAGLRFFFLVLILWTVACCLSEQSQAKVAAGVSGIVTDSSGAVISGATIQMKSSETGIVDSRQTNSDGFFAFVNLQPGHYDLEASQTGFTTFRQTGILLDVDSAKVLNIRLLCWASRPQPHVGLRCFISITARIRSAVGPFGPGLVRCLGENRSRYFRFTNAR